MHVILYNLKKKNSETNFILYDFIETKSILYLIKFRRIWYNFIKYDKKKIIFPECCSSISAQLQTV